MAKNLVIPVISNQRMYNPQNETEDGNKSKRTKIKTKRGSPQNEAYLRVRFFNRQPYSVFAQKSTQLRRGHSCRLAPPPTSSVQLYLNGLRTSSEGHSLCVVALRFGARCDRFLAFRLRGLDQRFESGHAERFKDFAAEGQTRPGIPTRIRCIVNRIRTRHAGKSKRVVGAAVDHTA